MTPEELYLENSKLIFGVLKRKYPWAFNDDDFQQIARIGLWIACTTFNGDLGTFSTYAGRCIDNEIKSEIRNSKAWRRNPERAGFAEVPLDAPGRNKRKNEDAAPISESVPGDLDVPFIDIEGFWKSLTEEEKTIVHCLINGKLKKDVANLLGITRYELGKRLVPIRQKFDDYI